MYQYNNLEKLFGVSLSIYKHGQCIYNDRLSCDYEYEFDSYKVCSSKSLKVEQLELLKIVIEKNELSQPFWLRVLKALPYDESEIPKHFKANKTYQTWIIKGKALNDNIEVIQALLAYSEIISLSSDMILVIKNHEDDISLEEVITHLEAEAMLACRGFEGPIVDKLSSLKEAYEQTALLMKIKHKEKHVILFSDMLFDRVLYELKTEDKQKLLEAYLVLYPVDRLNEELLETIYGFFQHSLNVTDTANALFLHRNTLVYRLNKIEQTTNLDIRHFEAATKMKILLSLL